MLPVAGALRGEYPLWVVRVAGHATRVAELAETSWLDWYASATDGARALGTAAPRLVVIGLSMGSLLALHLAIERPDVVAGVVLLSPAASLRRATVRRLSHFLRMLGALDARSAGLRTRLARVLFPKTGSDISDPEVRATHPGYRQIPLRALLNILMLQRLVAREAPRLTQPALVVHAAQDHTCSIGAARILYDRLGSKEKRFVRLERSFHVVTVDCERTTVRREVRAFVDALAARSSTQRTAAG
jgi:carboxylesterase